MRKRYMYEHELSKSLGYELVVKVKAHMTEFYYLAGQAGFDLVTPFKILMLGLEACALWMTDLISYANTQGLIRYY